MLRSAIMPVLRTPPPAAGPRLRWRPSRFLAWLAASVRPANLRSDLGEDFDGVAKLRRENRDSDGESRVALAAIQDHAAAQQLLMLEKRRSRTSEGLACWRSPFLFCAPPPLNAYERALATTTASA